MDQHRVKNYRKTNKIHAHRGLVGLALSKDRQGANGIITRPRLGRDWQPIREARNKWSHPYFLEPPPWSLFEWASHLLLSPPYEWINCFPFKFQPFTWLWMQSSQYPWAVHSSGAAVQAPVRHIFPSLGIRRTYTGHCQNLRWSLWTQMICDYNSRLKSMCR